MSEPVDASTITYSDRLTFQAALGASITDDYSAPGYQHGDRADPLASPYDLFSNAAMSAVFSETTYESTAHRDVNLITHDPTNSDYYCGGCNGTFRLTFDSTSLSTPTGVFGAGFNFINTADYYAFVTFGDGSTASYLLPTVAHVVGPFRGFFGITSDLGVSSIHLGLEDGGASFEAAFAIDNLTIGDPAAAANAVPDTAASMTLLLLGLSGLAVANRRQ
jgi:hypothetical protein